MKTSNAALENELFKSVYDKTPDSVRNLNLVDFSNKGEFVFTLTKKNLDELNLREWFAGYAREAQVSTAGIRGPQNILFPQDTRFPINLIGIILATLAKALVAREKSPPCKGGQGGFTAIVKIAGREVRYNS
ncbi:MAG: hypothetical protein LBJ74_03835, partial [Heliobacteriaceae bacterium]|nr:hypothetical protein [Heliobacteriaceae bacterium]